MSDPLVSPSQRRFLVTAGNTRELIDRVRDWGNIFTGNTGLGIAKALSKVGTVDLVTSNVAHVAESARIGIHATAFRSHSDLRKALTAKMSANRYEGIFMTAAVADYLPSGVFAVAERRAGEREGEEIWIVRNVQAGKVKSTHREIAVIGKPTEKLVDLFRTAWNYKGLLVKFKLEVDMSTDQLVDVAEQSRLSSSADYVVANTLEMVDGAAAGAFLLGEGTREWIPRDQLAARLALLASGASPDI